MKHSSLAQLARQRAIADIEIKYKQAALGASIRKLEHISMFYHDYHAVWGVTTEVDNILGHKGIPKTQPK